MNHSWRMRENSCANKGIVISDRPLVSGRRKRQKELASIISEKNRPRNKDAEIVELETVTQRELHTP